jgi:ABC-type glycerol-3-phosphate transport system substrate-binding protein
VTRVLFLAPDTDAYVASVQRHTAEFEEQTGLELDVRIIPSDEYFSNQIHGYLDGDAAADVYMSGPVLLWEHVAAGFVQPLDDLLERRATTTGRMTSSQRCSRSTAGTGASGARSGRARCSRSR